MILWVPIDEIGIVLYLPQIMDLHPSIQELLSEIEAFRERTGMAVTAFGLAAFNDPWFIRDLKEGRSPNIRTIDRAREFMRTHNAESAA